MPNLTFHKELDIYLKSVSHFMYMNYLPESWFTKPDHIAIKAKDAAAYDAHVEFWKTKAVRNRICEIKLNGRRLGTVKLKEPMSVGPFGLISWLELMEPRPEKVGKDKVGIDHMEFYFPDFDEVLMILKDRVIKAKKEKNPSHSWISVELHDGQELKINDWPLAKIIPEEIKAGKAHWV